MQIMPAETADIERLAGLWARAFPGERTVEQRIAQLEAGGIYGGIETAWTATDASGKLAGACRGYALRQHMHGTVVPMMGLAAVAVEPEARRHGLGASLCRSALRYAYDRGDFLSVLYPFRPSYYEALGWGLTGYLHSHLFEPSAIPVTHRQPRVRTIDNALEFIAPCYARAADCSNGFIERNLRIWRQHLEWPDVQVIVLERNGGCAGYMLAHYSDAADDGRLTIRELIADDDDAYLELLSWIGLHEDQWRTVSYDAVWSERFDLRLSEPRTPGAASARTLYAHVGAVLRGPMARLVNVASAIEARASWPIAQFQCRLEIVDEILPENCVPLHVAVDGGRAVVARGDAIGNTRTQPCLRTDIRTFTQVFLGEITVREARRLRRADVSGAIHEVDALFSVQSEFHMLDEF